MSLYHFDISQAEGRIDKFLAHQIPDFSRSQIQNFIAEGRVRVNDEPVKANYQIEQGDHIQAELIEEEFILEAEDKPLNIIYEDKDILLVNKPAGMVVHPAPGHWQGTLVNRLLAHTDHLSDLNGEERPGIVHRLDKDTSGLLIVAKNNSSHQKLAQQFKDRQPLRQYTALVHGQMEAASGTIDMPIGRDPKQRTRYAVVADGKEAISHFELIQAFTSYSLLNIRLETGRTHQIRVHLSHLGHAVVGDQFYGSPLQLEEGGAYALHASKIGFHHPTSGQWMEFELGLADRMKKFIKDLS